MGITDLSDIFHYVYSYDLDAYVQIKIGSLEGTFEPPHYRQILENPILYFSCNLSGEECDYYVVCEVFAEEKSLSLPVRTSHKSFVNRRCWNEWLTLPIRYCDLPFNSVLKLSIFNCYKPLEDELVGCAIINLFQDDGCFQSGMHDLKVQPSRIPPNSGNDMVENNISEDGDKMYKLIELTRQHHSGHLPDIDWLDRLAFREIQLIIEKEKRNSSNIYLMIEFPVVKLDNVEHAIVYYEIDFNGGCHLKSSNDIVHIPDSEIMLDNLIENKHQNLVRNLRRGRADENLKPNAPTRDKLHAIVNSSPTKQLTSEEQDMIWKYRFYLHWHKKALAKFLQCVPWQLSEVTEQAESLIGKWAAIDPEDALELLGPQYNRHVIRKYAVSRLNKAADEDLILYLLQLVQALRYEFQNEMLIKLKSKYPESTASYKSLNFNEVPVEMFSDDELNDCIGELSSFLIQRACANLVLANYFYWYVSIECEEQEGSVKQDQVVREFYIFVRNKFLASLTESGITGVSIYGWLMKQKSFVDNLVKVIKSVAKENGHRKKKIEKLQSLLLESCDSSKGSLCDFDPIPLPLDPGIFIKGIKVPEVSLFKSALMPAKLVFTTQRSGELYVSIFKYGDDLRQDQLIVQMIALMDRLLRRDNLDLKLTPYKVLATSSKYGFVQFVDSMALADVITNYDSILNFFKTHAPSETGPYGVKQDVMDAYVKSCAGYCVITFLLSVGDRHHDNLLLTKTGRLFHIDFGYILGRDPKPLPPPMKLSKEMVEGMGGINSEYHQQFRNLCNTAYIHLRRHANLILNLFSLMVDASVPDIALEPDKTVRKVQDKLRLDLSEEEAMQHMQNVIEVSQSAVMPAVMEQFHKFTQYLRK